MWVIDSGIRRGGALLLVWTLASPVMESEDKSCNFPVFLQHKMS